MNNRDIAPELLRKAIIRRRYRLGSPFRHTVELSDLEQDTGIPRSAILNILGGDLTRYLLRGEYDRGPEDRAEILKETDVTTRFRDLAIQYGASLTSMKIEDIDRALIGYNMGATGDALHSLFDDDAELQADISDYLEEQREQRAALMETLTPAV